jgi:hypothetical protein
MSDPLNERLNKILPRVISDGFLSGSGISNEIAFYIFDYPPEDELRVRDYLRTLLDHIPKQSMACGSSTSTCSTSCWTTKRAASSLRKQFRCSGKRETTR